MGTRPTGSIRKKIEKFRRARTAKCFKIPNSDVTESRFSFWLYHDYKFEYILSVRWQTKNLNQLEVPRGTQLDVPASSAKVSTQLTVADELLLLTVDAVTFYETNPEFWNSRPYSNVFRFWVFHISDYVRLIRWYLVYSIDTNHAEVLILSMNFIL